MTILKKQLISAVLLALGVANAANADQRINDDLIVTGSACIGETCEAGADFGFDTVQLNGAQPQIRFFDTSSSSAFPTTDWVMGVKKDLANISYFFVRDNDGAEDVLKLSAAANGGVALGSGSVLVENAVSVGSSGNERRVTHVADAVNPTDAVNLGQLQAFESQFEPKVVELQSAMTQLAERIEALNSRLDELQ